MSQIRFYLNDTTTSVNVSHLYIITNAYATQKTRKYEDTSAVNGFQFRIAKHGNGCTHLYKLAIWMSFP